MFFNLPSSVQIKFLPLVCKAKAESGEAKTKADLQCTKEKAKKNNTHYYVSFLFLVTYLMSSPDSSLLQVGTIIGLQQQNCLMGTGEYCCKDGSFKRDHSHLTSVDDNVSISDIGVLKKIIVRLIIIYLNKL